MGEIYWPEEPALAKMTRASLLNKFKGIVMATKAKKEKAVNGAEEASRWPKRFQTEFAKEFANDPFARLLVCLGAAAELKSPDLTDSYQESLNHLAYGGRRELPASTPLAPVWASVEQRAAWSQLVQFASANYEYRFDEPAGTVGQGARALIEEAKAVAQKKGEEAQAKSLEKVLGWLAPAGRPAKLSKSDAQECSLALWKAIVGLVSEHAGQEPSKERVGELKAKGRDCLAGEFGLQPGQIDALSSDPQLCKALGRLAFLGAEDPLLVPAMLRRNGTGILAKLVQNFTGDEFKKMLEKDRYSFGGSSMTVGAIAEMRNADFEKNIGGAGGHALRVAHFAHDSSMDQALPQNAMPMMHLRLAVFALSAPEPWRAQARDALLRATSTPQDPGAPDHWAKVSHLGDIQNKNLGMEGKRAIGANTRGESMRESMTDAYKIFQWRNPSELLARVSGAAGQKTLRAAVEESEAFAVKAAMALCAATSQASKHSGQRRMLAAALAERAAQGFAGLPNEPELDDLLPGYEAPPASGGVPAWSAGEAEADPMVKLASLAAKIHGLGAEDSMGLVGEAKRALAEKNGLTAAGWKGLAANAELRDLFSKAVQRSLSASKGPARTSGYGALGKMSEEIMSSADATGRSAKSRIQVIAAREQNGVDIESFSKALSAGAAVGMQAEDLAEALRLLEANASGSMCALISGLLPSLPKTRGDQSPSLTDAAGRFPLLLEDAKAISAMGPALLKSIMAKHKKNQKGVSIEEARSKTLAMVSDVCDCAANMPGGFWARLDQKDPMSHALRMHEEWVANLRAADVNSNEAMGLRWAPLVGSDAKGRVSAVEMLSGRELHTEGEAMRHCVSSYASKCREGASRIVSLRIDGSRSSTLELAPCDAKGNQFSSVDFYDIDSRLRVKQWKVVQHRGKCNAVVNHPELVGFAEEIAAKAQAGFEESTRKMVEKKIAEKAEGSKAKASGPKM